MDITVLRNVAAWNANRGCEAVRMSARAKNHTEYNALLTDGGRYLRNHDTVKRAVWMAERSRSRKKS